ncbi:MAG: tetratricopeptide repeat protein [Candidatus Zixiibacteriota bacterium]
MYQNIRLNKLLILISFFIIFLSVNSYAQPQVELQKELNRAELFLNDGKYSDAIKILKPLYSRYPENPEIISFLKRAYYDSKSYQDLIEMLGDLVQRHPQDWGLRAELGETELKLGQVQKAEQSFSQAIQRGFNLPQVYQRVALNYRVNGFYDKAIEIYKLGNKNLGKNIFSLELVNLYQITRDYKSCVEEYFNFMEHNPKKFEIVEKGMKNLFQFGEDQQGIEVALEGVIQEDSTNKYAYKLYADLLIIKGKMGKAFEIYKTVDYLWDGKGSFVLSFARECYRKKLFQASLNACEYLLSGHLNPELLNKARLCKANSLDGMRKFEEAVAVYKEIINDQRPGEEMTLSFFSIGEIKYKQLNQPEEAFQWYKKAMGFTDSPVYPDAMVRMGDCWLSRGMPDSAASWFTELLGKPLAQEKKEEIRFKLAEIDFYQGEFKSAQEKYQKLVLDFPKGFYVNNSLERISILQENMESNPLGLLVFSQAFVEKVKGNSETSLSLFRKLVDSGDPSLSDNAELQIGYILRQEGDFEEAILRLEKIIEEYPQSPYCALAQKLIGDIYYYDLNDLANAEKAYLSVLENFSSSLFIEEARVNLKRINQKKTES